MSVYIFYVSMNEATDRQRIILPDGRVAYIRVVKAVADTDVEALNEMDLHDDEQAMNTHEL